MHPWCPDEAEARLPPPPPRLTPWNRLCSNEFLPRALGIRAQPLAGKHTTYADTRPLAGRQSIHSRDSLRVADGSSRWAAAAIVPALVTTIAGSKLIGPKSGPKSAQSVWGTRGR